MTTAMNDFDWEYELSGTRSTEVRRHLSIDRRAYEVVAHDDGAGLVGMRVTGWDSGYLVTEMVGEIPAMDTQDVGNLIASALAGFRVFGADPPPRDSVAGPPPLPERQWWAAQRAAAPNAGKPWEPQDLELLMARFREGASVQSLTTELGRTEGGIRTRLQILGLSRPEPDSPRPRPDLT